jgi:hypothetical protein
MAQKRLTAAKEAERVMAQTSKKLTSTEGTDTQCRAGHVRNAADSRWPNFMVFFER